VVYAELNDDLCQSADSVNCKISITAIDNSKVVIGAMKSRNKNPASSCILFPPFVVKYVDELMNLFGVVVVTR
jgi:hypothetical protein